MPPPAFLLTRGACASRTTCSGASGGIVLAAGAAAARARASPATRCSAAARARITALGLRAPARRCASRTTAWASRPGISPASTDSWIEGNKLAAAAQDDRKPTAPASRCAAGSTRTGADQCQILANQISGFAGAASRFVAGARADRQAQHHRGCGNGIVSDDEAGAAQRVDREQHVSDIGTAARAQQGVVAAVSVECRAGAATVSGNTIRRVGQQATLAALKAGVAGASVGHWQAAHNHITGIAPTGEFNGRGAGVMLLAPFAQADVSHNDISMSWRRARASGRAERGVHRRQRQPLRGSRRQLGGADRRDAQQLAVYVRLLWLSCVLRSAGRGCLRWRLRVSDAISGSTKAASCTSAAWWSSLKSRPLARMRRRGGQTATCSATHLL